MTERSPWEPASSCPFPIPEATPIARSLSAEDGTLNETPVPEPGAEDHATVRRVLAGDADAYGELVLRHDASLRRLITGLLGGDANSAEDVLQDVYLLAYQKLDTFAFRGAFRGWLHRIAVREAVSARSRFKRMLRRVAPLDAIAEKPDRMPGAPARLALRDELLVRLQKVPAMERSALVLYAEGWSYQEIADLMERPIGTVSTWIHRARNRWQEMERRSRP